MNGNLLWWLVGLRHAGDLGGFRVLVLDGGRLLPSRPLALNAGHGSLRGSASAPLSLLRRLRKKLLIRLLVAVSVGLLTKTAKKTGGQKSDGL